MSSLVPSADPPYVDCEGDVHIGLRTALIRYTLSFSWNSWFFQRLTFYIEITLLVLVSFDISLGVCVYLGRVQRRSYKRVRISQVL